MPNEPTVERDVMKIMALHDFSWEQRRLSFIWAAKGTPCLFCGAASYTPCLNKTDINNNVTSPRVNRTPHNQRIDWEKLWDALVERGYVKFEDM